MSGYLFYLFNSHLILKYMFYLLFIWHNIWNVCRILILVKENILGHLCNLIAIPRPCGGECSAFRRHRKQNICCRLLITRVVICKRWWNGLLKMCVRVCFLMRFVSLLSCLRLGEEKASDEWRWFTDSAGNGVRLNMTHAGGSMTQHLLSADLHSVQRV